MKRIVLLTLLIISNYNYSQVSIGAAVPNTSANLDVTALDINGNKRGLLIPRLNLLNTTDATTINSGNVNSLLVYNEATQADVEPGFYYWYINKWQRIAISDDIVQNETITSLDFDTTTGTLDYINEDGTNPALDLTSLKIEPWQVETTTNQASLNSQNIYQLGNVGIGTNDMLAGSALDVRGAVRAGTNNTGAVGLNSAAFGTNNTVTGANSSAIGKNNIITGSDSGAVGTQNTIDVNNSMAIGLENAIHTEKSFAVGDRNTLSVLIPSTNPSIYTSAMGSNNSVAGYAAVAQGINNTSEAEFTYTLGLGNISRAMGSMVFGRYNAITTGDPINFNVPTDPYFQIGNGNIGNRTNVMTILKNGKMGLGNMNAPQATLHILRTGADLTPAIIEGCRVYADNAAATTAGVPVGGLYRTATGVLMVRY